jgi:hypothetical protein
LLVPEEPEPPDDKTEQSIEQQSFMMGSQAAKGLPNSERDRIFTSSFWHTLFQLSGTQLCMSSSYDKWSASISIWKLSYVVSCILVHKMVPLVFSAEYWYNTSLHSALGRSPFEVLYGYTPKNFGLSAVDASNIPELDEWLQERS